MAKNPLEMLRDIAQVIYDKNGMNILALDVQGLSTITDYLLIAEGHVDRHVTSIAHAVIAELKDKGETPLHVEGLQTGDWVVIDYPGIMVHLFMPGYREKFSLEKLWKESRLLDLTINTGSTSS